MTHVILHGELKNIQGTMDDGALVTHFVKKDPESIFFNKEWNYKEVCLKKAKEVFELGNYYSDDEHTEGWDDEGEWNNSRRKFVSDKWIELSNLIENCIKKTGRVDLELLDYFTPDCNNNTYINKLQNLIKDIADKKVKASTLVKVIGALDEEGY